MQYLRTLTAIAALVASPLVAENDIMMSYNLEIGESNYIVVPANASTGYTWSLAKPSQYCDVVISPIDRPSKEIVVGAPEQVKITFTALKEGEEKLQLVYSRPWEKDTPPTRSVEVSVKVSPSK